MIVVVIAALVVVVLLLRRRARRRNELAGLVADRPAFFIEPPTRRVTPRGTERL